MVRISVCCTLVIYVKGRVTTSLLVPKKEKKNKINILRFCQLGPIDIDVLLGLKLK